MNPPIATGPQLPTAGIPESPIPSPMMPPSEVAQLAGCIGCAAQPLSLSDAAEPKPMPLWLKLLGVAVFFGGVFGILALTSKKRPQLSLPPAP